MFSGKHAGGRKFICQSVGGNELFYAIAPITFITLQAMEFFICYQS